MHREARGRAWAAVLLAVCLALACEAFVVPIAKLRKPKDVHNEWRSAPIALSRPVLAPPPLDLTKVSSTLSLTPEQQPTVSAWGWLVMMRHAPHDGVPGRVPFPPRRAKKPAGEGLVGV